jgi:hypothetical protein
MTRDGGRHGWVSGVAEVEPGPQVKGICGPLLACAPELKTM